jgi:hypothetical protein
MSDLRASDVAAWTLSNIVDSTTMYARSGRKHRCLSDENLVKHWIDAFRSVAKNFTNSALWQAESDLVAEFTLRNQTPPYDVIAVELEELGSTMMLTVERMLSAGFEPRDECFNRFLTFVSEKNGPKN